MKKARLFLKLLMMLLLISISFFYAITFNNELGWVMLPLISLFSFVICLSLFVPLKKITFKDLEPMWTQMGEKKSIRLDIKNKAVFVPILIIKNDDLPLKKVIPLFLKKNQSFQTEWIPKKRGHIDTLIMEIQSSDFFSILKKKRNVEITAQLYVFPDTYTQVKQIIDLFQPSIKRTFIGESSFELEKIRLYQPGDVVRGIDWKLSSKKQQLIYREYEHHVNGEILFLFYGTKSNHFEWLLSVYYTLYMNYAELGNRFLLMGSNVKQREKLEATDFCFIQNEATFCELPPFKEKYLVIFTPEMSKNLETIISNVNSSVSIQLIDFETIKGRAMD